MNIKKHFKTYLPRVLVSLLLAAAMSAAAGLGWLDAADGVFSDLLYQRERATDGLVTVVGIDSRALDALGPMPWNRSVFAEAIEFLNADPENRPAVIGVDVLFVGQSADADADAFLAEAAALGENVVVAGAAVIGSELVKTDAGFYMDSRAVRAWDAPYPDLADAAAVGHINTLPDNDGAIRHALLSLETPEGQHVKSFARVVYEAYCERAGETPVPEPETVDGFFYLPYTGRPGAYYEGISVLDLLEGGIDPAELAGRIVLIGPYAAGMQDSYRSAIDHAADMYGVEIQANAIDAFRAGGIPRDAGEGWQLWAVFLLCLFAALFFWEQNLAYDIPVWLGIGGVWIGLCRFLFTRGWVLRALWVPLYVTLLFIGAVALNYFRAQRERRHVTETFGRYVDPAILGRLLEKGSAETELGGTMHEIAVLFVDIRGFTTMSEALDPPTVVEIINMYLTLTTDCIMRHHGTLDKFVGDCTMAFWNAPMPQEDAPYLACRAAMDMVEGAKTLGEELLRRFGRSVSFGVGVHYGPAVVGNIGAPRRMDYTAIGDTVNTAARLEANAPAGTVYISRAVADALGARAETTSLGGSIRLKGKAEGFEVLRLESLR